MKRLAHGLPLLTLLGCGLRPLNFVVDDRVVEGSQVFVEMRSHAVSCDRNLRCHTVGGEVTAVELDPPDVLVPERTEGGRWVYRATRTGSVTLVVHGRLGENEDSASATVEVVEAAQTRLQAGPRTIERLVMVPDQPVVLTQAVTDAEGRDVLARDYLGVVGDGRVVVAASGEREVSLTARAFEGEATLYDRAQRPVATIRVEAGVELAALELAVPVTTGEVIRPVTIGIAPNGDALCGVARVRMESLRREVCGDDDDADTEVALCSPGEMPIHEPGVCVVRSSLVSDDRALEVTSGAGVAPLLDR